MAEGSMKVDLAEQKKMMDAQRKQWLDEADKWVAILNDHKKNAESEDETLANQHLAMLQRLLLACDKEVVYVERQTAVLQEQQEAVKAQQAAQAEESAEAAAENVA